MKKTFQYHPVPRSRTATIDVYATGLKKHHVAVLLELDVTGSRKRIKEIRKSGEKISFNGWLIKAISKTLELHPEAAAFLVNKRRMITFSDINISVLVEKELDGKRVPIPLLIMKTNQKSASEITLEIEEAKNKILSLDDVILNKGSNALERIYYRLPGLFRRLIWKIMLSNPKYAYNKMGNVVVTYPGMAGRINGWFLHRSVHPVSIGIGSVIEKPAVVNNEIKIREILHMTLLLDHDVMDGAPMARFIKDLAKNLEKGIELMHPDSFAESI